MNCCPLAIVLRLLEEEKGFVKGSSLQVRCLRGGSAVLLSDPFVISLQCVGGVYMGASRRGNSKFSQHKPGNMTAAVKKKKSIAVAYYGVFLAAGQIGAAQNYQKRGHFEIPSHEISDPGPGRERRPEAFLHNGGKNCLRQRCQGIGVTVAKARPGAQRGAENVRGNRQACATPALSGGMSHASLEAGGKLFDPRWAN